MDFQESKSSGIHSILHERANRSGRPLTYAEFGEIALYDPVFGYYRRQQKRVGQSNQTDFYTATSMGPVFRDLVIDACRTLLSPAPLAEFAFVEIGAEPGQELLTSFGGEHPFSSAKTIPLGEALAIPPRTIVFSNELFDAQPFHRLIFQKGEWREIGVEPGADGELRETILPELSGPVRAADLPGSPLEGYHLDLPLAAKGLLREIAGQPWTGLFLAFDYGKSWRELTEVTPQGTARTYYRHSQSNDLLNRPGEQDLTCHVCWDWLLDELKATGFTDTSLYSQEAFFLHQAREAVTAIVTKSPGQFDPDRQRLQQLLHPGNMGQKFQVLTGIRQGE